MDRRAFLGSTLATAAGAALSSRAGAIPANRDRPNLVFVFADQWRAQATGYAGDLNVHTPNLDALANESINLVNAISGWPVCSPYRASLITGQYPHTHGVFLNDVPLGNESVSFAEAMGDAGYSTGYIGKWHIDGRGRSSFIPRERRQGFQFWRVLECTHDYNRSYYYGDDDTKHLWDGYDAIAQTREAQRYIREHAGTGPFALFLSWGPPHNPYESAPPEFRSLYDPASLTLRPNVPNEHESQTRKDLAGYYAHCTALDMCAGELLATLRETGVDDNTVFVFTSDHGDMLGSQGEMRKQRPWDESIRVPFLLRMPVSRSGQGLKRQRTPHACQTILNSVDIMPTLLSLCGVAIPKTVEGRDRSRALTRSGVDEDDCALLACYSPFGEWTRPRGGREYRGVRTFRYTYIRMLEGPWLLYDNLKDPYQLENLAYVRGHESLRAHLDALLRRKLDEANDEFLPGRAYIDQWRYQTDKSGTVPYAP